MNAKKSFIVTLACTALLAGCGNNCTHCHKHKAKKETTVMENEIKRMKLPSGLEYEVIKSGEADAPKPQKGQNVVVHYTGRLVDGTKFDSSVDRGQPFVFRLGVGQVIQGWDEGVALMKVGDKWRFTIPAELAYGNRSVGGVIPADSTLVFEVELIGVG